MIFVNKIEELKKILEKEVLPELKAEIEALEKLLSKKNDKEIKDTINAVTVAEVFTHLKKEVDEYYGESN